MMEGCKYTKMTSLSNCIYVCNCSAPLNFDKKWRDLEEAAELVRKEKIGGLISERRPMWSWIPLFHCVENIAGIERRKRK